MSNLFRASDYLPSESELQEEIAKERVAIETALIELRQRDEEEGGDES